MAHRPLRTGEVRLGGLGVLVIDHGLNGHAAIVCALFGVDRASLEKVEIGLQFAIHVA